MSGDFNLYRECLRNHGSPNSGCYALDGCSAFIPTLDKCKTCGCHRNFHSNDRHCFRNHAARLGYETFDGCTEFVPSLTCFVCGCRPNFHRPTVFPTDVPMIEFDNELEQLLAGHSSCYGECLRNPAPSLGNCVPGGCRQFIPTADKCLTCGCHGNFHLQDGKCCKNHASGLGRATTDGCIKFVPSLTCSYCECHQNFHRLSLVPNGVLWEGCDQQEEYMLSYGSDNGEEEDDCKEEED